MIRETYLFNRLHSYLREINLLVVGKWIFYSIVVGIIGGLGAVVFYVMLDYCKIMFSEVLGAYIPPSPAGESLDLANVGVRPYWWVLLLVPTLGGLVSGLLVYTFAPEAEGHGTDALINSFHRLRGTIRKRIPVVKAIASAITIGSGGSAGREGPIAQIGAGFGSFLGTVLNLSARDRRILVLAGAAAGVGSIFKAPLGGALFATEVLYREPEFEFEAIMPCIISSIVAYSVFASFFGWSPIFATPKFVFNHPIELFLYGLFGIVCAVVGIGYIKVFYVLRDKSSAITIPPHLKPAIGGFLLGCMACFLPHVLGTGYGWVQLAIHGKLAIWLMFILALAKILATSLTIGTGGSGGVFAPSLTIGAMLGGAFGQLCHTIFPDIVTQPTAFVLVGMGGFFAGVAKVPIASLIMVCEMAGSYGLLAPLMLVSAIAFLFTGSKRSLYENQVNARLDSPAHRGDFIIDVLENLSVKDALIHDKHVITIPESMPLKEIVSLVTNTTQSYFPIVNYKGTMVGIISMDDIRRILLDDQIYDLVIAGDMAITDIITVTLDEDLNEVMRKFTIKNLDALPVVSHDDSHKLISMITRREVLSAYNKELQQRKEAR